MNTRRWRFTMWVLVLIFIIAAPVSAEELFHFDEPALNGPGNGIVWPAYEQGDTAWFLGTKESDANDRWHLTDNILCLSFNRDRCTGTRIDEEIHAVTWAWEATYQATANSPELIENNVNVISWLDDEWVNWRPWSLKVMADTSQAWLTFENQPGELAFSIHRLGGVRVGERRPGIPKHRLEVFGSTRLEGDVEIEGELLINGKTIEQICAESSGQ